MSDKLDKNTPSILAQPPSEAKKAMALGLLYRGDKLTTLFDNPTLRDAYYGGTDKDFEKAVADYYNSKNLKERAKLHTTTWPSLHCLGNNVMPVLMYFCL